jgi:hypothetical protein
MSFCECGCGKATSGRVGVRFARGHGGHGGPRPIDERFWEKIVTRPTGCWEWIGRVGEKGYGYFYADGQMQLAHRYSYKLAGGEIPAGQQLDHTCHNADTTCCGGTTCLHRRCVNPEHLEPVTPLQNLQRSSCLRNGYTAATHCIHGHPFDLENTYMRPTGGRMCKECVRRRKRAAREKARAA